MSRKNHLGSLFYFVLLLCGCHSATPYKHLTQAEDNTPIPNVKIFMESLIERSGITLDTTWKDSLNIEYADGGVLIPSVGDDPDSFAVFPFPAFALSYNYAFSAKPGGDRYFFSLNGHYLPDTLGGGGRHFPYSYMHLFSFKGGRYLEMKGCPIDYNGYGDRAVYNYFFDLSAGSPRLDVYDCSWASVDEPFLYGSLNNDSLPDRLKFDGFMYPAMEITDTNFFNIEAQTYRSGTWVPLTDKDGIPYTIKLITSEGMDSGKIYKTHWMNPLP